MATGIPKRNNSEDRITSNEMSFRLEYAGKTSLENIMATKPAVLDRILNVEGKPGNKLIYGDNLRVLRALMNDDRISGKVNLIYIDPPYATRSHFESREQNCAYQDLLWGAEYLEFLRQRLILMREILSVEGSIYVHLDDNMAFPVKVLMDEIFGSKNFRNWITRKKCNPKNSTRNQYGNITDYILFYSKADKYVWNQPFDGWNEETSKREYQYVEESTGRRYKKVPIHAPGVRNGATGQEWRGMKPPPGKHWQYLPKTLDEMDARGEIYWSATGNPRRKIYLDESKGIPVQDIWLNFKDAHNQNIKITGYPTEKNPDMLKQIIEASSNEGDIVLDAFAGSGTTIAVAEELNRKWIAIDNSLLALQTIMWRLAKGTQPMGDFINVKNELHEQKLLLELNRVLHSGLDLYVEENADLELIGEELIENWRNLFNSPAILW